MSLLAKLQEDLTDAMKAKDEVRVSTLRFVMSSVKNAQIAKGEELSDEEVLLQIGKEAKKHKESIAAFKSGGREELAKKEEAELEILSSYLPKELSDEEIEKIVFDAIEETGAKDVSAMGQVMQKAMAKAGGRVDGSRVSALVRKKLAAD